MTWVIGAASPLGHGIVVSDIRVTFNGKPMDMLQKAYPVGNFMVAGFAGSVSIGFSLLDSLVRAIALPPEVEKIHIWDDPACIAREWAPRAKAIFDSAPPQEKVLGSQLLLVGISPTENTGAPEFPKVYIVRFSDPDFEPGFMGKGMDVCNIGSGARVDYYKQAMKPFLNNRSYAWQAEVDGFGMWAQSIANSMSTVIADHPSKGISEHLNILVFRLGKIIVFNTDKTIYPPDGLPIEIKMPKIARSYAEFEKMARQKGIDAACAMC